MTEYDEIMQGLTESLNHAKQSSFDDEVIKYKKKSKSKPPRKSDHKHEFKDCIFEWDNPQGKFDKEKGFISQHEIFGGSYCHICGKISYEISFEWNARKQNEKSHWYYLELSEEAKRQVDTSTRTLPTFSLEDKWYQKYLNI